MIGLLRKFKDSIIFEYNARKHGESFKSALKDLPVPSTSPEGNWRDEVVYREPA